MILRYSRPAMRALWTEEAKLNHWQEIEVLACEGMAIIGNIPKADAQTIRKKAKYRPEEVHKNECFLVEWQSRCRDFCIARDKISVSIELQQTMFFVY